MTKGQCKPLKPNYRLKAWRAIERLSQKDVAKALGLSQKAYSFKENGKCEFRETEINKLLVMSGLTYEELFMSGRLKGAFLDGKQVSTI